MLTWSTERHRIEMTLIELTMIQAAHTHSYIPAKVFASFLELSAVAPGGGINLNNTHA